VYAIQFDTNGTLWLMAHKASTTEGYLYSVISGNSVAISSGPLSYLSPPSTRVTIETYSLLLAPAIPAKVAPSFTANTPTAGTVGSAYSYTFTATGVPAPTFALASGALPAGLTLNTTTGVLSGTPTGTGGISGAFTVKATNGEAPDAAGTSATVVVAAAPLFTALTPGNAVFDTPYTYSFAVSGYPVATTYTIGSGSLPSGLTLSTAGVISGTPNGSAGTSNFTVTANNTTTPNATTGTLSIAVTVPVAPAFILYSPDVTATVNVPYSYTFTASGTPAPTFALSGPDLPTGWALSSAGVLTGTATSVYVNPISVTVVASNGFGTAATTGPHTITVQPAPASPLFTANTPSPWATVGTVYESYQFTATGYPAPTFSAVGDVPAGLTLSESGLLSGTPTGVGGDISFMVLASNNVNPFDSVELTIVVSAAPILTSDSPPATALTGTAFAGYTFTATGSPRPTFSLGSGALPAGMTLGSVSGVLAGTPSSGSGGVYTFTVKASNEVGSPALGASHTLTVSQSPVLTADLPGLTATSGTAYPGYTFEASGYPAPIFVVTGDLPNGLGVDPASGVLSGTPSDDAGDYTFFVTARNDVGTAAVGVSHTLMLSVPAAPVFGADRPPATATVGTAYTYAFTATGYPVPTFSSTTLPTGWVLSTAGVLSAMPTTDMVYQNAITFTVTASNGVNPAAVGIEHTITVSPAPAAPVFTVDAPASTGVVGTPYVSHQFEASGYPVPTFTVDEADLPLGLTFTDGLLSGTPTGVGGVFTFTVHAGNSVDADVPGIEHTVTISAAPIFTAQSPALTATVGTAYTPYTFTASGYPTAMTFTVASGELPAGLTLTAGVLSGTPTGIGGTYTFTVTASNTVGSPVSSISTTIVVSAAPVLTADVPTNTATVGVDYSFTYTATGTPTPTFAVTAGVLPAGLSLSVAGVLSGKPTGTGGVTAGFTVTASNTVADTAGASRALTVAAAPIFTDGVPTLTATVGTAYVGHTFTATGHPTPTFTAGNLPPGFTFDDGVLAGTPTGVGGTFTIQVTAHNATADVDAVARTFIVDAAPVVTADEPTPTATVGTAYSFTYAATGYPVPTFAVSDGELPAGLTLSEVGVLSGTPTGTGGVSGGFTVTASNIVADAVGASRTITVSAAPILTADAPPTPAVGVAYSYTFTATGFPAPAFTSSGTLPAGLTLSEEGVLEGIATIPGSYTFTITAVNNVEPDAVGTPHTLVVAVPALNLQLGFEVGSVVGGATSTATAVGLMVDSPWIVQVFSTPHTIASGFVGNTGAINANIGLPTTLEPGLHHLVFTGMSASGETLTTTVWFTVSVRGTFLAISTVGPTKTEAELAKTGPGTDSGWWLFWALLAMVAGAGMVLRRRRLTPR
jgi:LPXTG-motif cell wall-anchored protein